MSEDIYALLLATILTKCDVFSAQVPVPQTCEACASASKLVTTDSVSGKGREVAVSCGCEMTNAAG